MWPLGDSISCRKPGISQLRGKKDPWSGILLDCTLDLYHTVSAAHIFIFLIKIFVSVFSLKVSPVTLGESGWIGGSAQSTFSWVFPLSLWNRHPWQQESNFNQQSPGQNHEISLRGPHTLVLIPRNHFSPSELLSFLLIYVYANLLTAALKTEFT